MTTYDPYECAAATRAASTAPAEHDGGGLRSVEQVRDLGALLERMRRVHPDAAVS